MLGEMLAEDPAGVRVEPQPSCSSRCCGSGRVLQQAVATRRQTYVDLLTAHGVDEPTATTSVDLAMSMVWGRTVVLNAVAGFDADRIRDLLITPIVGSAGNSTNRRP